MQVPGIVWKVTVLGGLLINILVFLSCGVGRMLPFSLGDGGVVSLRDQV